MPDDVLAELFKITGGKAPTAPRSPSSSYDDLFEKYGEKHDVDPDLLRAMTNQESSFNPRAVSPKNAQGLMQLIPGTARRFGVTDVFNPEQNIEGGTKYMKFLLDRFGGDVDRALAGYNAGEGAVDKYKGIPPYRETQDYVKRIRSKYKGGGYRRGGAQPASTSVDEDPLASLYAITKGTAEVDPLEDLKQITQPSPLPVIGAPQQPAPAPTFPNGSVPLLPSTGVIPQSPLDRGVPAYQAPVQTLGGTEKVPISPIAPQPSPTKPVQAAPVIPQEQLQATTTSDEDYAQYVAFEQSEGRQPVSKPDFDKLVAAAPQGQTGATGYQTEAEPVRQNREAINAVVAENNAANADYNRKVEEYNRTRPKRQAAGTQDQVKTDGGFRTRFAFSGDYIRDKDEFASRIANGTGLDYGTVRAHLDQQGLTAGQGRAFSPEVSAKWKGHESNFEIDAETIQQLKNYQRGQSQKQTQANKDFEQRKAQLPADMDPAERELELLRLRGLADADAGRRSFAEVAETYEAAKAGLEEWKRQNPMEQNEGAAYQSALQGDSAARVAKGGSVNAEVQKFLQDQKDRWEQNRQKAISEYGSLSGWNEAQQKTQADLEKIAKTNPLLAAAIYGGRKAEAVAGGAMKAVPETVAAISESIAIASEAIDKALGVNDIAATERATHRFGQDLRKAADEYIKIHKSEKGGMFEQGGNVFGQIAVMMGTGGVASTISKSAKLGALAASSVGGAQGAAEQYQAATETMRKQLVATGMTPAQADAEL